MNKKQITVTYDGWEARFEVNAVPKTLEAMEEAVRFWVCGDERLEQSEGDVMQAYFKLLCQEMIVESIELNKVGMLRHFKEAEGWFPLDGSKGVTLLDVSGFKFEPAFFNVVEQRTTA